MPLLSNLKKKNCGLQNMLEKSKKEKKGKKPSKRKYNTNIEIL